MPINFRRESFVLQSVISLMAWCGDNRHFYKRQHLKNFAVENGLRLHLRRGGGHDDLLAFLSRGGGGCWARHCLLSGSEVNVCLDPGGNRAGLERFFILVSYSSYGPERRTLIGPDTSRYCTLIGGTLLCWCHNNTHEVK